jgi:glycosyltransferase involved in cell wall biosynthesis
MSSNFQPSQATQPFQPKIAALIPCFNTECFVGDVVSGAKKYVDQVIVVDDGSYDGTKEAAKAAGALVISHEKNMGKGAAMKTAAQNTDADIIVFIDSDGQHDPGDMPKIIAPILENKASLVIGSRCLLESKVVISPLTRRLSNNLASFIISVIISVLLPLATLLNNLTHPSKQNQQTNDSKLSNDDHRMTTKKWITDCTSGFRAIRRESLQKLDLISQGFQIETEMIYEAAKNKLTITEVPISCNWNNNLSQLSILRDSLKTLGLLACKLRSDTRGR